MPFSTVSCEAVSHSIIHEVHALYCLVSVNISFFQPLPAWRTYEKITAWQAASLPMVRDTR